MPDPVPPLKVGDVLHINEPDYLYGTGVLRLRITKVGAVQQLAGHAWISVEGFTLAPDGTQFGQKPRHAVVRVRALRYGLQPPSA
jgi:hypothetical protein